MLDIPEIITTEMSKTEPVIQGSDEQLMEQGDQEQTRVAEMQITPTGTESPVPAPQSPSEGSQAVLDMAELITTDILRKAELEMQGSSQELEEQGELEQSTAADLETVPAEENRESLVSAPHSPCSTASPLASSLEVLVARKQENPQAVAQEGPSSASSVGTQVAAEAARELPSPAPAPLTPTEAEPAAAAPAGAAEEEEPQGPLAPEETKAEGSAASGELVPSAGTQSPVPAPQSPSEGSQALLDTDQSSSSEFLSKAKLKIQGSGRERVEQGDLEESTDTETGTAITADGEGSPVPAPQSPCSPPSSSAASLEGQALREQQEEAERGSFLSGQGTEEGALAGEGQDWKYYVDQEISQWEDEGDQELSPAERKTSQEVCQGEERREQELSPGAGKSSQEVSDWDEDSEEEEPQGEGKSYQEVSDWEENLKQ
ncbi:flocculation protein FLO11-like, partial [Empidonax traillii]|uniref:flocculation protein FLO11-like n=1 Tax=Empidonax traillii TaxID=164674 RepID=UPI000FFD9512